MMHRVTMVGKEEHRVQAVSDTEIKFMDQMVRLDRVVMAQLILLVAVVVATTVVHLVVVMEGEEEVVMSLLVDHQALLIRKDIIQETVK